MKKYQIEYWDKYYNRKTAIIKAKSQDNAEYKWYKNNQYTLITRITLI